MEIKAAVTFEKSAEFQIMPIQLSDPNDDEILVRTVGAGIKAYHASAPAFAELILILTIEVSNAAKRR